MPSLAAKQAMYSRTTSEVPLALLDLYHVTFADGVLRLVNNLDPIVSLGNTFVPAPFTIQLPKSGATEQPAAALTVLDIAKEITPVVLGASDITARVHMVLASTPDVIEESFPIFILRGAKGDASTVSFELTVRRPDAPFPGYRVDPINYPGLF